MGAERPNTIESGRRLAVPKYRWPSEDDLFGDDRGLSETV